MTDTPDQPHQPAADPNETPGAILQRCREFQHLSLDDAAEATKISKNYLRALENNRPSELPNLAYLKGFLKIYATFLGLNSDDLLRLYQEIAPQEDNAPATQQAERIEVRRRLWQRLLLPAVLLTAIMVTALFYRQQPTPVRTTSPIPQPEPVAAVQAPFSSPRATGDQPTPAGESSQAQQQAPPVNGLLVRLKVLKNGHLTVTIDDGGRQPYELTDGDLIEWKAERSITLELGDGGSVTLELNGKPVKVALPPGKPASLQVTERGVQQLS